MSNEYSKKPRRRPYTQKVRALRRDEVHRRITLAAVHLHGSVGPAHTTMEDIATRAGVRRATVYNHFPTDSELLDACSSHWFSENPPPNPEEWIAIVDPLERAATALRAMYEYYDRGQQMLEKVFRDAPQIPALEEILRLKWRPLLEGMAEILTQGWNHSETELRATSRVAFDFFTWQTLSTSGLSNEEATRVAVGWIAACAGSLQ